MSEPPEDHDDGGVAWRRVRRGVGLALVALVLYVVAPTLVGVYGALGDVADIDPRWLTAIVVCEVAHLVCTWELLRLALRTRGWMLVATSQLASNAVGILVPGGAAVGAATQHRMLKAGGVDSTKAASALTAVSLLTTGSVFALPVLALPVVVGGAALPSELRYALWLGALAFVVLAVGGAVLILTDRPLVAVGRLLQRVRNRLRKGHEPVTDLPERLVAERNLIRTSLDDHRIRVTVATVGRTAADYLTLLVCLAAVGASPDPSLVLVAFAATEVIALLPITPGGIGIVEAGLTATLAVAGVPPGEALIATAAYRLATFWLPLPAGAVAALVHRRVVALAASTARP